METQVSYQPVVAIAGVTGAVGAEFIANGKARFPVGKLKALASARSAGKPSIPRPKDRDRGAHRESFEGVDIALFSAGGGTRGSSARGGEGRRRGGRQFLGVPDGPNVPLVIPRSTASDPGPQGHHRQSELRGDHLADAAVADPRENRIKRLIVSTYQAASGAGAAAMEELVESTRACLNGQEYHAEGAAASLRLQPLQPQHGDRSRDRLQRGRDQGHQGDPQDLRGRKIAVGVTCVRVPVLRAHCVAITFECERPITEDEVRAILARRAGREDRR